MEPLFVVTKVMGSPNKNDSLLFIQNCFKCDYETITKFWAWVWPLQYCCVWQPTNNSV